MMKWTGIPRVTSVEELEKLSRLMGVPEAEIESALTTRYMEARGESFAVSLTPAVAKDGCDALAKEMYAQVFDYLVKIINRATNVHEPEPGMTLPKLASISILDIFGFESFEVNQFEQLLSTTPTKSFSKSMSWTTFV